MISDEAKTNNFAVVSDKILFFFLKSQFFRSAGNVIHQIKTSRLIINVNVIFISVYFRCSPVMMSTRSGGWIFPNYIFGQPYDLYSCRALLALPWSVGSWITETVLTWVQGNPKRYVQVMWTKSSFLVVKLKKKLSLNYGDAAAGWSHGTI